MSYGSPSQAAGGQWNPNGPPPTSQPSQQQQQQGPPQQQQWSPQPPMNGQQQQPYQQQPRSSSNQLPDPQARPLIQQLQPNPSDNAYRGPPPTLPPPHAMYPQPYQQAPQMAYPPTQPAPRQRTAIACRYCRRRKIRCSGFEQSEEGRCTNCVRFAQDCVFTPVSAQTQAFVPAHTVWRGQNPPPNTQLYGAYGQPLPPNGRDQYPPPQGQPGQPGQQGQYPPPPPGYQQQPVYPPQAGSKRSNDEPHTPTMPPPGPGAPSQQQDGQYAYPNPLNPAEKDTPAMIQAANDRREEALRTGLVKDMGVQVEIIKGDGKEQAS